MRPRQPPVASSRNSTNALKRIRSDESARREMRVPEAVFSNSPCGWKSIVNMIRVSWSLRRWKVTMPIDIGPFLLRQTSRSHGICSTISASHERRTPQMFSCHISVASSRCSMRSTRCMNLGQSSNWVNWS